MWALTLLAFALASHAALIAWLRRVIGRGPQRTLLLVAGGLVLSLSLFGSREYFGYTSFELSVVTLGAGLFVALLVGARAVAIARRTLERRKRTNVPAKTESEPRIAEGNPGRREAFVRIAGGVSWAASASVLGWGALRGRHDFELVEIVAKIPGLPRALDGYTIVQISDLHIGTFVGEEDLARGLELVTRARPDLLVFTGDLVDFDASLAPMVASRIARVAPRDGIVGILGNHDYYADPGAVRAALDSAGINVLVNESRVLRARDGGGFVVVGLDDYTALRNGGRGPDLARTLATTPNDLPRILLAHQPKQFDEAAGSVALQLSGHTHGYQFDLVARAGRLAHKYVSGRYEKSGSLLWVNRGFGVTGPPSRVGVPPEITKIVLAAG